MFMITALIRVGYERIKCNAHGVTISLAMRRGAGQEAERDDGRGRDYLMGSILSRRARSPDPARAKRVLGESRGRASLDNCARRDPRDAGNPAQILRSATMSHETIQNLLIRNDRGETRPATGDEILRAARDVMSRRVRRGTSMSSPQAVRDFLAIKL